MNNTRTRTDTHRAAAETFNPGDYALACTFYQGSSDEAAQAYTDAFDHDCHAWLIEGDEPGNRNAAEIKAAFPNAPYAAFAGNHADKGTCDHCGAGFSYGVILLHRPTQTLVHVGHICAGNTFTLPSRYALLKRNAEAAVRNAAELAKIKPRVAAWVAANPETAVILDRLNGATKANDPDKPSAWAGGILMDMAAKLNKYGELSERQIAFIHKLAAEHAAQLAAAIEEAKIIRQPVPESAATTIRGTLKGIKTEETDFGTQTRMLVEHADGWKVWGTLPLRTDEAKAGDVIEFRVSSVERSRRDPEFGFFKRPGALTVVTRA